MKKQTLIIVILCVLVAAVIALSVLGVLGPQKEEATLTGYTGVPTVSPPNTIPGIGTSWDHSYPTMS